MDISETQLNSATVLALAGRLDGLTSGTLENKIGALLAAGTRKLVLDCAQLVYISSAGLRVFLSAAKKMKAAGGAIAFASLTPVVQDAFELSGFTNILAVHPNASAAAAALG
jgi:anti-anti-sigma factor